MYDNNYNPGKPSFGAIGQAAMGTMPQPQMQAFGQGFGQPQNPGFAPPQMGQGGFGQQFGQRPGGFMQGFGERFGQRPGGFGGIGGQGFGQQFGGGFQPGQGFGGGGSVAQNMGMNGAPDFPGQYGPR
jgi:hypothetical protein